eukprot:jgi/Botrbrau1/17717/Bobra.0166s0139.1
MLIFYITFIRILLHLIIENCKAWDCFRFPSSLQTTPRRHLSNHWTAHHDKYETGPAGPTTLKNGCFMTVESGKAPQLGCASGFFRKLKIDPSLDLNTEIDPICNRSNLARHAFWLHDRLGARDESHPLLNHNPIFFCTPVFDHYLMTPPPPPLLSVSEVTEDTVTDNLMLQTVTTATTCQDASNCQNSHNLSGCFKKSQLSQLVRMLQTVTAVATCQDASNQICVSTIVKKTCRKHVLLHVYRVLLYCCYRNARGSELLYIYLIMATGLAKCNPWKVELIPLTRVGWKSSAQCFNDLPMPDLRKQPCEVLYIKLYRLTS